MDKLKMHSKDKTQENFEILQRLFPNAVTETITGYDEDGKAIVERAIDKDVLQQEINAAVVEGKDERYQFTWPDKKRAIVSANAPINKTLRPCREESVDFDNTENLYIEGDNLEVLKLLQETYLGKIKMIYIDPPYNTGHDFVYNDKFSVSADEWDEMSGELDEYGNRLTQNTESNGRFHTDWLNMIYPRLKIARDLLSDDGVIFISCDDNEEGNLRKTCDDVFGESCFVANISWQRTYSIRNDSKGIPTEVEHLFVYSKMTNWEPKKLPRTEKMNSSYNNPDGDYSPWMSGSPVASDAATHQGMVYAIQSPFTGKMLYPSDKAHWRYNQNQMLEYMNGWCKYSLRNINDDEKRAEICGIDISNIRKNVKAIVVDEPLDEALKKATLIYQTGPWPRFYFTNGGYGGIRRKVYLDSVGGRIATNYWSYEEVGHTDEAKKELKNLFDGTAPFDTPKPVRLMERILEIASNKDSLVLDFFSGSASLAHAVMRKNASDGGDRKFILVQLPEKSQTSNYKTLCEIGKERIRRAGSRIKEELRLAAPIEKAQNGKGSAAVLIDEAAEKYGEEVANRLDIGFRVLKLDSSNMKDVYYNPADFSKNLLDTTIDNIKDDRTPEDLLFQVMLDLGVLLSSKIEETEIAGKKVFNVADGFLIACFDNDVNEEVITAVAKQQPIYFVMRDSSLSTDTTATNFDQIFETYSPTTVRRVI